MFSTNTGDDSDWGELNYFVNYIIVIMQQLSHSRVLLRFMRALDHWRMFTSPSIQGRTGTLERRLKKFDKSTITNS